jgi:hypothetical protein
MGNEAENGLVFFRDVADIEPPRETYALCGQQWARSPACFALRQCQQEPVLFGNGTVCAVL